MSEQSDIYLLDRGTGKGVAAVLIHGISEARIAEADASWQAYLQPIIEKKSAVFRIGYDRWGDFVEAAYEAMEFAGVSTDDLPEDVHWEWHRKKLDVVEGSRTFGIEFDNEVQGLMLVRTDKSCRMTDKVGLPLVYIDNVATAPWNLEKLAEKPRFAGIGLIFVAAAIELSRSRGWDGRVGLHSLPGAEGFYRKCCMADLGIDDMYESLRYFEMSGSQARDFLGRGKG